MAIIGAVATIVVAYMERARRQTQALAKKVDQTHYQVQNDHKTNLRHDIDETRDAVQALQRETGEQNERILRELRSLSKSVGGLRDDLRVERQERMQLANRVQNIGA